MYEHHGHRLRKGRHSEPGRIYSVTTVTFQRRPVFADFSLGRIVVSTLRHLDSAGETSTLCFAVMPDHLHWLFELGEYRELDRVVHSLKTWTARQINPMLGRRGPLWQRGFHDRALRYDDNLLDIARYIVANPLRGGIVEKLGDYPLWDAVWLGDGPIL